MNEKQKTPMQIAIDLLEKEKNNLLSATLKQKGYRLKVIEGRVGQINITIDQLKKIRDNEEKQALIDAFISGQKFEGREQDVWIQAEVWYNEKYGNHE